MTTTVSVSAPTHPPRHALRPPTPRLRLRALSLMKLLLIIAIIALLLSILLPSLARARELSKRLVCAANMKGLGLTMSLYEADNPRQGYPPPQFHIEAGNITPKLLLCPSTHDKPGQCSYVIVALDKDKIPEGKWAATVWVYEPKAHHGGEGGNVLFLDGHVTFQRGETYDRLVKDATGGR